MNLLVFLAIVYIMYSTAQNKFRYIYLYEMEEHVFNEPTIKGIGKKRFVGRICNLLLLVFKRTVLVV